MSNITIIKLRFLLRNNERIIVPMDDEREIKTFLFKYETKLLRNLLSDPRESGELGEYMFEALRRGLYFNEFLIQLFHEKYDVFIASISFEFDGQEYNYSDVSESYYCWIDKEESRMTIDEEFARIEMDIYQFDDYIRYFGMDESNLVFNL